MTGPCLTCGMHTDDLQAHHFAGRHNDMKLTVLVCIECHDILSTWQRASGVELSADAPRGGLDIMRALLVGVVQLMQLTAQRHPERPVPGAPLAIHTARAISKVLDACGAPDRPGRWLPDPTMAPDEAIPVAWPPDTEAERTTEWAHLVRVLADMLVEQPSGIPAALETLATNPGMLQAALDAHEPVLDEAMHQLVEHVTNSHQMILRLLALEDIGRPDSQFLEEGSMWIAVCTRLLEQALSIATGKEVRP